jgi:hypothetical protein
MAYNFLCEIDFNVTLKSKVMIEMEVARKPTDMSTG